MPEGEYLNAFTLHRISNGDLTQNSSLVAKLLNEKRRFRIALLDENGRIIQISESFVGSGKKGQLIDYIKYDARNNKLSLKYEHTGAPLWWVRAINPLYIIIGIIIIIAVIKLLIYGFRCYISELRHGNAE